MFSSYAETREAVAAPCPAELLRALDKGRLAHVVAAHLSQENNRPELARSALSGAMNCSPEWVAIADQDEGLAWRQIG